MFFFFGFLLIVTDFHFKFSSYNVFKNLKRKSFTKVKKNHIAKRGSYPISGNHTQKINLETDFHFKFSFYNFIQNLKRKSVSKVKKNHIEERVNYPISGNHPQKINLVTDFHKFSFYNFRQNSEISH